MMKKLNPTLNAVIINHLIDFQNQIFKFKRLGKNSLSGFSLQKNIKHSSKFGLSHLFLQTRGKLISNKIIL